MCTEKHVLAKKKKMLTNGLHLGLLLWAWTKRTVHGVETNWFSGKEKVSGAAISKEDDTDSLLGHKKIHHYWFPWKRCKCKLLSIANFFGNILSCLLNDPHM